MVIAIIVILLLLAVLILAGPALENIIDRIWPPTRHR
jgi:hypothetical protein